MASNKTTSSKQRQKANKYYNNGKSYMVVKDNSLLILNSKAMDIAVSAIKVCNGFYIELGRPVEQFENIIMKTRIPIMIERVNKMKNIETYNVIRVETGNVDDVVLCSMVVRDGIIESIIRSLEFKKINNFEKYIQLGSLWKLSINKDNDIELCKYKAINTIKTICRGATFNYKFTADYRTTRIIVKVNGDNVNQEYSFQLNESTRRYELLSIKLCE